MGSSELDILSKAIDRILLPAPLPVRQPDLLTEIKITVEGIEHEITAEVFAKWHEGEARTHSHPGANQGWEIEEVKYQGTFLTPLLSEDQLDAIARELS
jgi:hypothetical protein